MLKLATLFLLTASLGLAMVLGHKQPLVPIWPDHMENVTLMGCDIPEVDGAEPGVKWWHSYLWLEFKEGQEMSLGGKPWGLVKLDDKGKTARVLGRFWTSAMEGNRWTIRIAVVPGNEDLKAARFCHDARKEAVQEILQARNPGSKK